MQSHRIELACVPVTKCGLGRRQDWFTIATAPGEWMTWESAKNLPNARADGLCSECQSKPSVTRDGRFCRKCLAAIVKELSPGPTRRYPAKPGDRGQHSGTHLIDRAERKADRDYWRLMSEGCRENGVRAMEGD